MFNRSKNIWFRFLIGFREIHILSHIMQSQGASMPIINVILHCNLKMVIYYSRTNHYDIIQLLQNSDVTARGFFEGFCGFILFSFSFQSYNKIVTITISIFISYSIRTQE